MKNEKFKIKKILLSVMALTVLLAGGLFLTRPTSAQESFGPQALIQRLAERFGLNQDELEEVFEQHRLENQNRRRLNLEENLDQAVEEGKLTESQKEAFLSRLQEKGQECEQMNGLSWEEREQLRQEHHQEMEEWAQQNGIDLEGLMDYGLRMHGSHMGMFGPDR